jgi:hypothetical protein
MENGVITSGSLEDSDNDGLWTFDVPGGTGFQVYGNRSEESLANIRESLDAMKDFIQ